MIRSTFFCCAMSLLAVAPNGAQTLEERVNTLEMEVKALKALLQSSQSAPGSPGGSKPAASEVKMDVILSNKRFQGIDFKNRITEDSISWDSVFTLSGTSRKVRAVKGALVFSDLFDDSKIKVDWTINEPMTPGVPLVEKGNGIRYNQFMDSNKWLNATELKDMKVRFEVENVIYAD